MAYKSGRYPLFQYSLEEKQEILKELNLKESTIEEDVTAILEWFEKQPHLIDAGFPGREFIEKILINSKGSREETKLRIDSFYRHRSMAPELIQNRTKYHLNSATESYRIAPMPMLVGLRRLTILEITDASNLNMESVIRKSIMLGDLRMQYDYMLGDIWIWDLRKATIGNLLNVNPLVLSKGTKICINGYGIRLYAIHVIGVPMYANQVLQFLARFAKPKIIERIIFHNALEDLHKHIPKKYLPKDFGGDGPSINYLNDKCNQELKTAESVDFLTKTSKMISDESKRPGDVISDDYLPGSFKKLVID